MRKAVQRERREDAEGACHGGARCGTEWETREECPHEWGHGSLKGRFTGVAFGPCRGQGSPGKKFES